MSDNTLKNLLKEYEQKRLQAELALENRKRKLYSNYPRLQEIDAELNSFGIQVAKNILKDSNTKEELENLQQKIDSLKKEKDLLLLELQVSATFFEPYYACSICKDTGYVQHGYTSSLCRCIKQHLFDIEYNKSNITSLEKDNFAHFDLSVYSGEKSEEMYRSNLSPRENITLIKDICLSFIENFQSPEEKNLLFTGNTGLGKTFLSNCIANELLKKGKTVLYQTASVMLDTIIDYRFNKGNVSEDMYHHILDVDLLIIDDLGTEHINSLKFAELFNVINSRLLNQNHHITKTIISTNLNLQNLKATYDERIFSRFVGYYNICRFFGEDIRFKK